MVLYPLENRAFAIKFENITKKYSGDNYPAVNNVTFSVPAGNLIVILGPSGCGKTTLIKTVNRLIEPTGGSILLDNINIQNFQVTELRRKIGYVIQHVGLFPHMTILENISVVPKLLEWDRNKIGNRVDELLEMIGLSPKYLERYPRQLSGGEQQRVGLIRAMAADPGMLLMDEPFASLDAINRESLQEELLQIQRNLQKTILLVTHDVEEAFRLADKILVMQDGKIVQYDMPFKLITNPKNSFVSELVGTEDLLRKLSLIKVSYMVKQNQETFKKSAEELSQTNLQNSIQIDADLRSALMVLLQSERGEIFIKNSSNELLGSITFQDLTNTLLDIG